MPIATGTIYRIICLPEPNIQYIGSTFTTTKQRWTEHKKFYKRYCIGNSNQNPLSIFKYFDEYGVDNCKLIKIKEYKVWREHQKDTKQLRVYEQLWINKTKCINGNNAFGIKYLTRKDWKRRNKEHIKKQGKEYRSRPEVKEQNKQRAKEYMQRPEVKERNKEACKKFRNTEKRKEYIKKYKQTPEFKEKQKEYTRKYNEKKKLIKITCSCGSMIRKDEKKRHERTMKHLSYIESI